MFFLVFRRGRRLSIAVLAAAIAALISGLFVGRVAHAQPLRTTTFLYLRGADTLGTETLHVTDTSTVGVLAMRGQPRIEWTQMRRGETLTGVTLRVFGTGSAAGTAPMQTATITVTGDTATADIGAGGRSMSQKIPTKAGALPLVNASVLHEVLLGRMMKSKGLRSFDVLLTSGGQTMTATLAPRGDTLVIGLAGIEARAVWSADGAPSVVTTSQNIRVVRATGDVPPSASLGPKINYDAPAGAPYTAEHVRIPSGRGYDLAATLTRPIRSAPVAVVVTISGSGQQERDERLSIVPGYALFREIADTLGRRGVAVLRFDDRGAGESGGSETLMRATTADFADDVRSIVAWLRARPDIDGSRIALAGHSEGGIIAPMVAVTDPKLKAIALLAGTAYTGRRVLEYQIGEQVSAAPAASAAQRDSMFKQVPFMVDSMARANAWLRYFVGYDPSKTARAVKQPVLILQGETDRQVTPDQADALVAALKAGGNTSVVMKKFPATNHLFVPDASGAPSGYAALTDVHVRKEVLGALAEWAVATLK